VAPHIPATTVVLKQLFLTERNAKLNFKRFQLAKRPMISLKMTRSLLFSEASKKEREKNKIVLNHTAMMNDNCLSLFFKFISNLQQ